MAVPTEMDALIADAPVPGSVAALERLRFTRVPVPRPGRGRVLVKIHAAPCNPADLYYIEGRYGIDRPLPATPGFEGAGEVVASGGGLLGRWLVGKRVACGGHHCTGTWAQYCEVDATQCMPLRKGLSFEQGATALANPMTALALLTLVKRGKHKAFVQNGAAGQLGKMLVAFAAERRIPGIHIVRRPDQAEVLRGLGAEHVLVSSEAGFEAALAAKCKELRASIAFDAVAGAATGQLANALAPEGEVVIYGALSGEACSGIDPMKLAFGHRTIRGFEIAEHLRELGLFGSMRLGNAAQKRVASGAITTAVRDRLSLADGPAGLAAYVKKMSDGKMLLMPVHA
jgi:NADPH:quinone reductase-like Zn-dependent oxidoreductase